MDTQNTLQALLNTLRAADLPCAEIQRIATSAPPEMTESELEAQIQPLRLEVARLMDLARDLEGDLLAKLHAGETVPAFTAQEGEFLESEGFEQVYEALLFFGQP